MSEDLDREIAELEAARARRKEENEPARKAQLVKDLKARARLEEQFGDLTAVKLSRFVKGVPTFALVRAPQAAEYKSFQARLFAAEKQKGTQGAMNKTIATDDFARACWVYPESQEEKNAMLGVASGLLANIAFAATTLAQGEEEEEGKG